MALRSKHNIYTFAGLLALSLVVFSAAAFAQVAGEALWRVDNEKPAEQAPLYEGQPSPFPIELPPVTIREEQAVVEPTLSPQEVAAQNQAREAASRMSRIRDLLFAYSAIFHTLQKE